MTTPHSSKTFSFTITIAFFTFMFLPPRIASCSPVSSLRGFLSHVILIQHSSDILHFLIVLYFHSECLHQTHLPWCCVVHIAYCIALIVILTLVLPQLPPPVIAVLLQPVTTSTSSSTTTTSTTTTTIVTTSITDWNKLSANYFLLLWHQTIPR